MIYQQLFQQLFARFDAETAHHAGMAAIKAAAPLLRVKPSHTRQLMGLKFPGVLGLAAGFDKNAEAIDALAGLGFGFIEIGTVTGEAQPGNPKPRLFRLVADQAIINRMGFNNDGAEVVASRLAQRARKKSEEGPILGINIGKTKLVPDSDAIADYQKSTRLLAPFADYLVVNVSSPNTPGLRDLQSIEKLGPLLQEVRSQADQVITKPTPLLVKIAPDLADADIVAVTKLAIELGLDGIIATNTTIARTGLTATPDAVTEIGAGGLSGAPLTSRANQVTSLIKANAGEQLTIIAAGGVMNVADASDRLAAGADLLQAYTGFIYGGPFWPRKLNKEL